MLKSEAYTGRKVFLNQGSFPVCTILGTNDDGKAKLKIAGWVGEFHWYELGRLSTTHPLTGKPAEQAD